MPPAQARVMPCMTANNVFPVWTSLALLHVHLQMCLQPWTHVARSGGTLSGAGLQPAGLKHALSGSMVLLLRSLPATMEDAGCAFAASSCSALQCNYNGQQQVAQGMHVGQTMDCSHNELLAGGSDSASRRGEHGSRDLVKAARMPAQILGSVSVLHDLLSHGVRQLTGVRQPNGMCMQTGMALPSGLAGDPRSCHPPHAASAPATTAVGGAGPLQQLCW